MFWFEPPRRLIAEEFCRLPDRFRQPRRTPWSDANRNGAPADSFLEGPSFDRAGNLWFTDIPNGRVFLVTGDGAVDLVTTYDGWPNGLKIHRDGRIFITDYRRGLMQLDPVSGQVSEFLATRNSEAFKGVNDLHFAANGDLYFTDQGQTGMHDPTGRVYRLSPAGKLDMLLGTIPSPNGLTLDLDERRLFVAVTRANAVWRMSLMPDGGIAKAGVHVQLSGGPAGPDGMALDAEGGLVVCHLGIGVWRFDARGIPTHLIEAPHDPKGGETYMTNVAFGGSGNRYVYMTESAGGRILRAELPVPGHPTFALTPL